MQVKEPKLINSKSATYATENYMVEGTCNLSALSNKSRYEKRIGLIAEPVLALISVGL